MSLALRRGLGWRICRLAVRRPGRLLPQTEQERPRVTLGGVSPPGRATAAVVKYWLGPDATSSKFLDFRETM